MPSPGNRIVYGHLNILANPHVGILFMIPGTPETESPRVYRRLFR